MMYICMHSEYIANKTFPKGPDFKRSNRDFVKHNGLGYFATSVYGPFFQPFQAQQAFWVTSFLGVLPSPWL